MNTYNNSDQLPIREEVTDEVPFRVCSIQMEDLKRCADQVFSFMLRRNILLNIEDSHRVSTFLCTASVYELLTKNGAYDPNEKVSS